MGIIAKQSIKGTIVTYLGVVIGFITTFFVLTRFLSAEEIGLVRVLVDAATLFVGLAQLGTSSSLIRFSPSFKEPSDGQDSNHYHGLFFWALVLPFLGFLVFAIVYWACKVPLTHWFSEKSPLFVDYYYFVLPIAFFLLYQTIFETGSNILMRIVVPRAVREVGLRVGLLALYLLYAYRVISMDGFVIALSGIYALAALINLGYLLATGHIDFRPDGAFLKANPTLVRRCFLYTGFLLVSAITSVLAPSISSFFVTAQMGLSYTGIFAIATYMAVMISIPYRSLTAIAAPQLATAIHAGDTPQSNALIKQIINNTLIVGTIIFLLLWINIDLIYWLLPNGTTYAAARTAVFILAVNNLILATFSIVLNAINYGKYYALSLVLSAVLTTLAIVFNNVFVPRWGMNGAALSSCLSYAIYMALSLLVLMSFMHLRPFAWSMLWVVLLFGGALGLNYVLDQAFVFLFTHSLSPTALVWLSSLVRDVLLLGTYCFILYRFRLSPEIDALLRSVQLPRH